MHRFAVLAVVAACGSSAPTDRGKLRDVVLAINGHANVVKMTSAFADYRDVLATAKRVAGVTSAEPIVFENATAASPAAANVAIEVKGVEAGGPGAGEIEKRMIEGTTAALAEHPDEPRVILGRGLGKQLAVHVGDEISIAITAAIDPEHIVPARHAMRVAGFFQTDVDLYDDHVAIVPLAAAQAMLGKGDTVTALELRVADPAAAAAIAAAVERALGGPPYRAMGWQELDPALVDR